jgi:hypothetical protein
MGPLQSVLVTKSPANEHPSQKALDKQNRSISRILTRQSDFCRKSGFWSNPFKFYFYFKKVYTVKFYSMSKFVHSSTSAERTNQGYGSAGSMFNWLPGSGALDSLFGIKDPVPYAVLVRIRSHTIIKD